MHSQACSSCGSFFEVEERLGGGIVNCPACGRATEVADLRNPLWKGLVAVVVVGWLEASYFASLTWGPLYGLGMLLVLLWWLNFFFDTSRPLIVTVLFNLVAAVAVGWFGASYFARLPWWTIPGLVMALFLRSWLNFLIGPNRLSMFALTLLFLLCVFIEAVHA